MTDRKKYVFYQGAACGGCDVAVMDINEKFFALAQTADILMWPMAFDGKFSAIEALPDTSIDVCFFSGGVHTSETERVAHLLRAKSKVMVAFGACACLGGVPGLANQFNQEQIRIRAYETTESTVNPEKSRPLAETPVGDISVTLPQLFDKVRPLGKVVKVDYLLPGCPPATEWILTLFDAIAAGTLPPAGSVIGLDKTMCDECPRERKNERSIKRFYRPYEIVADPKRCLLEQGIVCSGPVTRAGCGARCIAVNMPCRGCYGPTAGVIDQGAKMLGAVSSLVAADTDEEISRIVQTLSDPTGTYNQFDLAESAMKESVKPEFPGAEKRKAPRVRGSFFITYRVIEDAIENVSEAKNLSMGGMLLTTNRSFEPGTKLALEVSLPTDPNPIMLIGKVIESREVAANLVYDTRLEFIAVDDTHKNVIGQTVDNEGRTA